MKLLRILAGTFLGLFGALCTFSGVITFIAAGEGGIPRRIPDFLEVPFAVIQLLAALWLPFKRRIGAVLGTWATWAIAAVYASRLITHSRHFLHDLVFASLMALLALSLHASFETTKPIQRA